ncbi:MAG: hypothetical protein HFJ51_00590 [Clostridia bacterium]|nr:hypothetical protein [Clostridia bacterium]
MELKLNIYNKKEIKKTYINDTYDLMFGTVEDFLELVKIDEMKTGSDSEIIMLVGKAIPRGMNTIKSLLKEVFEGITDDELKNTKVKEIINILVDIVKSSIVEMKKGMNGKNA